MSSGELDAKHGFARGDLESTTGVKARYVCDAETQIDLAVSATPRALIDAQLEPNDVDFVISASAVPYQPIPSTGPLVMRELGISDGKAAALDINSTCLSFPALGSKRTNILAEIITAIR